MSHNIHFKQVCQYGFVHNQCRCPSFNGNKKQITTKCDREVEHRPLTDDTDAGFLHRIVGLITRGYRPLPDEVNRLNQLVMRLQHLDADDKAEIVFDFAQTHPVLIWNSHQVPGPPISGVGQKVYVRPHDDLPSRLYEITAYDEDSGEAKLKFLE